MIIIIGTAIIAILGILLYAIWWSAIDEASKSLERKRRLIEELYKNDIS